MRGELHATYCGVDSIRGGELGSMYPARTHTINSLEVCPNME